MKKQRKGKFFFKTYLAIFSDMHIISNEYVKRKSFERQFIKGSFI